METDKQLRLGEFYQTHSTTILNQEFRYRALSRLEINNLKEKYEREPAKLEEEICKIATLSPEDFDFLDCPAGIPTTLATEVLKKSGFFDTEYARKLFERFQDEMLEQENRMDMLIMCAMPGTSIEEIQSWPPEKYLKMLAMSEFILINVMEMPPEKIQRLTLSRKQLEQELRKQQKTPDIPSADVRALSRGQRFQQGE